MIKFDLRRLHAWLLIALLGLSGQLVAPATSGLAQSSTVARTVSAVATIQQRGNTVLVGVQYDHEPFGFVNAKGEVSGFEVDLVRALVDRWDGQVQFIPVTASDKVQKLAAGAVDMLAATPTHNAESERVIDFSQSYFSDQSAVLVAATTGISQLTDLQGKTIAAVRGSSAFDQISRYAQQKQLDLTILPFQEYPPAMAAVKAGQVQGLAASRNYLARAAQADPQLTVLEEALAQESYALGLPQSDSLLRGLVNATLQELKRNGLYDRIYQKWFPTATPYAVELFPGEWPFTLATSPTALTPPQPSRLAAIRQRGKLIVGVKYDFPPFGFLDTQNKPAGFEVELAHELARRWLGDRAAVELVPVTDATRIPFLVAGSVDLVIAALPHTNPNDATIDFSQTYFVDEQSLLVKATSPVQTLADLKGKSIAVINGSSASTALAERSRAEQIQLDLLPFQEYLSAFQALKAGQVDAFVASQVALTQLARENSDVRVIPANLAQERYAIGLPDFDSELRDEVNFSLQALKQEGIYDLLYQQWFGQPAPDLIELWISGAGGAAESAARAVPAPIALIPTATPTELLKTPTPVVPTRTPRPIATSKPTLTATATTAVTTTPTRRPLAAATATPQPTLTATAPATPTATRAMQQTVILVPTVTPEEITPTATVTATLASSTPLATYRVQVGDTLATIAQEFYGDQGQWPVIYEANKAAIGDNPNVLVVGVELTVPELPR